MTGTNHMLAGVLIGLVVKQPALATPLSLMSHFVLDALPHFGYKKWENRKVLFKTVVSADVVIVTMLIVGLVLMQQWFLLVCGLIACSPDFVWIYRFTIKEKMGRESPGPPHWMNRWHADIQRFESPKGLLIELVFAVSFLSIIGAIA